MDNIDDKVSSMDQENADLKRELQELREQGMVQIKAFANEQPKEFIKMMCEAALGIEDGYENPFKRSSEHFNGGAGRYLAYVSGLAKIVLDKVMKVEPVVSKDGYTTFLSVIADYFHFSPYLRADEVVKSYDLMAIQHDFFAEYADPLASAIDTACHFVFEGLPLYRKLDEEQVFQRLAFDDPLFMYVYKKGEYFESGPTTNVPDWVGGLYFKDSDWEVHQAFFSGSGELLKSELDLRRNALRSQLGLPNDVDTSSQRSIGTMDLTSEVDRLKAELDTANAKITSLQSEVLKGYARTSALKVIGGLAMVGAELDIHSGKIEGITDVVRDLALKGVDVTDDTLRKYLKDASNIIGKPRAK